ncbi:MAG TPA: preprotein translocase subunit SecE [Tepidisphaeraceae bacterium]|jgi:preprotein translocase subunit SecE|nr:preprotein translocase subunit SecE [Tepidisphaeraceae bacterium]
MASVVKDNQMSKPMPDEDPDPQDQTPETEPQASRGGSSGSGGAVATGSASSGGFFHIYKSGQGYWTRMGTVAGSALIILLMGNFLYTNLPAWSDTLNNHRGVLIGIVLGSLALLSLLAYTIMNKPTNADFLIATDSEMKKVNWTSREELIGSTKIVIIFVFLITMILFVTDIVFGYIFYWLKVLKQPPF